MILTVTMNPSIDVSYPLEKLDINTVNRVSNVSKTAGGKGLNVSRVLKQLGAPITATGVVGGYFGNYLTNQLEKDSIEHSFSKIAEETRSCIAILHESQQTEILEFGPEISKEEQATFLTHFTTLLPKSDYITISGSLPRGISQDFYARLIKIAAESNVRVLLDTSGEALAKSIESDYKPFLIKPNETEVEGLLERKIDSIETLVESLKDDKFNGIEWIVVTLGSKGALVKNDNTFYLVTIPRIDVVNPVGSGDATIAGLAYSLYHNDSPKKVMKTGMVTGMLNAMEEKTGYIDANHFDSLFSKVKVERV